MKSLPPYRENTEHYRQLIAKINHEVNFPNYLNQLGYKLTNKSAGSMEFRNDLDRIVLNTKRNPMTYFNRADSMDKGLFFKFLSLRSDNFFKTIARGMEISNQVYDAVINLDVSKSSGRVKSLEENYNIVPLQNSTYLTAHRDISEKTLDSRAFKGRIFSAYHIRDNGGKIANIAFPKFDLEGKPRNYILYNRPYRSKIDGQFNKFRLLLNRKDNYLFYSKPVNGQSIRVLFGESGLDLLSYKELHGKTNDFYVSFGGNVYKEKLDFFVQLMDQQTIKKKVELISITDNDHKGFEYDLKVFTAIINHSKDDVHIDMKFRDSNVEICVHYTEGSRNKIAKHSSVFKKKLRSDLLTDTSGFPLVKCITFSDKVVLEFNLEELTTISVIGKRYKSFEALMDLINGAYLSFPSKIYKSNGKDWNDDLRESKRAKYKTVNFTKREGLTVGDKIELKASKGPEGSTNIGTIKNIEKAGVVCDFGLSYTYSIPFSSIAKHYILESNGTKKYTASKSRKTAINNDL